MFHKSKTNKSVYNLQDNSFIILLRFPEEIHIYKESNAGDTDTDMNKQCGRFFTLLCSTCLILNTWFINLLTCTFLNKIVDFYNSQCVFTNCFTIAFNYPSSSHHYILAHRTLTYNGNTWCSLVCGTGYECPPRDSSVFQEMLTKKAAHLFS